MAVSIFTSPGCIRCVIVKNYLKDAGVPFEEYDIKTPDGDKAFKVFYRENRSRVRRDRDGIFFPVVTDGEHITQDAGATLAWFICGSGLETMIVPNNLGHGWIGGLYVSEGDEKYFSAFLEVVRHLKRGGLNTEITANGRNVDLLRTVLKEELVDRLVFHVPCPLPDSPGKQDDLAASLKAIKEAPKPVDARYFVDIALPDGTRATPDAVEDIAKFMHEAAGDNRLPLRVLLSDGEEGFNLFPYRTAARRWQVLTEAGL